MRAAPFLKWAGGKTQLLPALDRFFPAEIPDYAEPFVGSAAVFFHLRARGALTGRVVLADVNPELINAYEAVRDQVDALGERLAEHREQHSRDHYYRLRAQPAGRGVEGAARTIYLNKTCFNGLYRVNRRGEFNVPMGSYRNPRIFDAGALRAASEALQGVTLLAQEFSATIGATTRGFLYVDPPYVPLSPTASFTSYSAGGFGPDAQTTLAECLREAHRAGTRFVLSNSDTSVARELYQGFRMLPVPARRAINRDATRRGCVSELLVWNFDAP